MLAGLGFKSPETRRATGFDDFLAALEKETVAFGKPVVYVHGDTHIFRVDKPLFGSTSRRSIENFTRVATFGYPDTHWVRAIVDPKDPQVFEGSRNFLGEYIVAKWRHPSQRGGQYGHYPLHWQDFCQVGPPDP
jgi:hypothetical protein